ncbi:glycosyltransferase family A protein [Colwellia sp. Arc7-D]|uniref:glycosyltransferase family 2 protein n=1 Tax=Colwellia sp. Arc7-D TaxID=2161872 RepID=UPI000D3D6C1F|nr:glycosyltransferase family A protein [Colwellia sp. Arc7-D]AWB56331.1 hypothetical protein DBO93_01255 [Colwellia sp. Arc7-D]
MANTISVVIPFFKRQKIFDETIQSVFAQTLKPLEIIVVDDCSGGDAIEFLKQYEPQITIIALEKNVGVSKARNIGVKAAKGEYIAFLDSDDYWSVDKLEKQYNYMQNHPEVSLTHTGCRVFYPDQTEKTYIKKPLNLLFTHLIKNSHVTPPSVMIKKQVFEDIGGFDPTFRQTEDYELSMRLITQGHLIHFIPEALTHVRLGTNDKISSNWKGFFKGHVGVVQRYKKNYVNEIGILGYYYCIVNYIEKTGYKQGKIFGKLLILIARILKLILPKPALFN